MSDLDEPGVGQARASRPHPRTLIQLVDGLLYDFPKNMRRALKKAPHVAMLHDAVAQQKRSARYLQSERRIAFNEDGIFRHCPKLDA